MGFADDRREVVLAVRLERDVAQHDHLVVAVDLVERAPQELDGILVVAAEPVFVTRERRVPGLLSGPRGRDRRRSSSIACGSRLLLVRGLAGSRAVSWLLRRAGCASGWPESTARRQGAQPRGSAAYRCRPGRDCCILRATMSVRRNHRDLRSLARARRADGSRDRLRHDRLDLQQSRAPYPDCGHR